MSLRFESNSIVVDLNEESSVSPAWDFGGYTLRFVSLQANEEFRVSPGDYIKVLVGMLTDPLRLALVGPFEKSSTVIVEDLVKAGSNTILLVVSPKNGLKVITSPSELQAQGPYSDQLRWTAVGDLPWGERFRGVEFYNLRGWDIRGSHNKHMAYIQAWLVGSGVNCGNHTHAEMNDNTFREVHLCISNGSGLGGMVWIKDGEEYTLPLLAGEEHGPFWDWSEDLTKVVYPVHRWQAGGSELNGYDFFLAIELPPPKAAS